jgi:hypothetical protein
VPFIACRDLDAGEVVLPFQIEEDDDLFCPTCEESMRVVSEHTRGGSQIPKHFRHHVNLGCEGESNEHKHAKCTAAQLLDERLPELLDPSINYEIRIEERLHRGAQSDARTQIDVLARFDPPAPRWGKGLAIEVQHANKAKEIHSYTQEVLAEEISILWASSERFLRARGQLLDGFDELILGTHPDLDRVTHHPQTQLDASSWDRYPLIERSPTYHLERIEYTSPEIEARDHLDPLRVELRAANRDRGKGFRKTIRKYVSDWQSKLNPEPGYPYLREIQRRLPKKRELDMRVKLPPEYWRMIHLDQFGLITWSLYYLHGPGDQHEQEVMIIDAPQGRVPVNDNINWGGFEPIEWEVTKALPAGQSECDQRGCHNTARNEFITSRDGVEVIFTRCGHHMYITKFELVHRSGNMRFNQ